MKKTFLITGPTGNIGLDLIRGLDEIKSTSTIIAASPNPERAKEKLKSNSRIEFRKLDFSDPGTYNEALYGIDIIFLLRPPQYADVKRYFEPFLDKMVEKSIKQIIFLSVQGVENQKSIPHHKLEKMIIEKGFEYVFLRPSYFMQNLTSNLLDEIINENKIFIPSGSLKFTWVDTKDIGLVGAHVLEDFESFKNQAIEITGAEQLNFKEVADILTEKLGRKITFESPNLLKFYKKKRSLGSKPMMILVMIMLHYLPRFSKRENKLSHKVNTICGRTPTALSVFIDREKDKFISK